MVVTSRLRGRTPISKAMGGRTSARPPVACPVDSHHARVLSKGGGAPSWLVMIPSGAIAFPIAPLDTVRDPGNYRPTGLVASPGRA
ncbi:hypothetical protein NITHO_900007 [Nitrolancea hollandica Lb]|uniref:Uncharacterized protein n=1 Tax=Nitrolancea hollandica Lb TaxID=1129897 RepID=I4ENG9_9BACT|nr:hypothetical protein NITHO_900007 [Nitrolancea hollandica Lb]